MSCKHLSPRGFRVCRVLHLPLPEAGGHRGEVKYKIINCCHMSKNSIQLYLVVSAVTCSAAPARRERRMSRMVRNWGAQRGHSRSFSPKLRALKEWPHMKCPAGSSSGLPLSAQRLFWNTRACAAAAATGFRIACFKQIQATSGVRTWSCAM